MACLSEASLKTRCVSLRRAGDGHAGSRWWQLSRCSMLVKCPPLSVPGAQAVNRNRSASVDVQHTHHKHTHTHTHTHTIHTQTHTHTHTHPHTHTNTVHTERKTEKTHTHNTSKNILCVFMVYEPMSCNQPGYVI